MTSHFNLPLDLSARLLGRTLEGRLRRLEGKSRAGWCAFAAYLAIDCSAVGDNSSLFHQVLQSCEQPIHDGNNVLISRSTPDNEGYGPCHVRVATLSTHTYPADWLYLSPTEYQLRKAEYQDRMLAALSRALPDAPGVLLHAEFASPRNHRRYTRRSAGAVGCAPV